MTNEEMSLEQVLEAYPEGTAEGFAGYCDELTAWQIIVDIATELKSHYNPSEGKEACSWVDVSPKCIAINGSGFTLVRLSNSHDDAFMPPELINSKPSTLNNQPSTMNAQRSTFNHINLSTLNNQRSTLNQLPPQGGLRVALWSLSATVFRMIMGCNIMNGRGGKAQKETSKLPVMRSEMPALSRLVQQCLDYNPAKRPSIDEVIATAKENLERCKEAMKKGPRMKPETASSASASQADSTAWPEEMVPAAN